MDKERASGLLFLGGLGLMVFAFAWPWLVGGERAWNDEDAKAYTEASSNLHDIQGRASHPVEIEGDDHHGHSGEKSVTPDDVEAAKEKFNEVQARRDAAMTRGTTVAFVAKILAAGVLAAGCVFRYLQYREEN